MYRKFNANPGGRIVGDCTIRAISLALDQEWDQTFMDLVKICRRVYDMPSSNAVWGKYLKKRGFVRYYLPEGYTVKSFAKDHPNGTFICPVREHVVCIKNGDWYDTWDSGDEIPLYIYERMN